MENLKTCARCKSTFIPNFPGTSQRFCSRKCQNLEWSAHNPDKKRAYVATYRAKYYAKNGKFPNGPAGVELKAWMNEIKSNPCQDCGGTFPVCCMDFDYRKGTLKSSCVSQLFARHAGRELIEKELAKCDLVCANCHRIRTRERKTGNGKYKRID